MSERWLRRRDLTSAVFRRTSDVASVFTTTRCGVSSVIPHVKVGRDSGAGIQNGIVETILAELDADARQIGAGLFLPADTVAATAFRAGLGVENLAPAFRIARAPHQLLDGRNALLVTADERRQQRLRALMNLRIAAGVDQRGGEILQLRR